MEFFFIEVDMNQVYEILLYGNNIHTPCFYIKITSSLIDIIYKDGYKVFSNYYGYQHPSGYK